MIKKQHIGLSGHKGTIGIDGNIDAEGNLNLLITSSEGNTIPLYLEIWEWEAIRRFIDKLLGVDEESLVEEFKASIGGNNY